MEGLIIEGKVRQVFDNGDGTLTIYTTDAISANDRVFPTPIPGKMYAGEKIEHDSHRVYSERIHYGIRLGKLPEDRFDLWNSVA